MTQENLLQLAKNKDEQAFTYMYDMYAKSLFAVISNIVRNQELAELALQETFINIWNNIGSFNADRSRLYTWMVGKARETAVGKLPEKDRNLKLNPPSENFVRIQDTDGGWINRVDSIGSREFVKKLKPKCIQMIELLFFRGCKQNDAAEILELPEDSIGRHNRSCISDLRNYLQM